MSLFKRIKFAFGLEKVDLLIYDDIFPHPISGFRLEEFTVLLKEFKNSKIILNPLAYKILGTPIDAHQNHIEEIIKNNDYLVDKLISGPNNIYHNSKLFYCIFLTNIVKNLKWLEQYSIPFIFTLYPGGGFKVRDEKTDDNLKKVFQSDMFRKVIVTQEYTKSYLKEKKFCGDDQIEFIFGCVVPQLSILEKIENKLSYKLNKNTFDVCFCAAKYSKFGKDKGYDLFIEFAHSISLQYDFIRFHVIGGFDENDIDVSTIEKKIYFYGYQNFDKLKLIFNKMDTIVSPNRPFILNQGAFDGFPLGTVVEAALNGVVALVTDCLNQNEFFLDKEEILIIKPNSESIESSIIELIENPSLLNAISRKGREKFSSIYSNAIQMKPRIKLLQQELTKV